LLQKPPVHLTAQKAPKIILSRLEQMLQFLEKDPQDSFTRYAVALEYRSANQSSEALQQFRELLARDPNYLPTYYQLGQLLASQRDFDGAERAYREGIALARKTGDLHTASELDAAIDELVDLR